MEESGSETQLRCPCGFWGSSKTLGLCSVCYRKAHRGQTQGTSHSFDAGKAAVGNCQPQSSQRRMDSKPFPSRSTTDNLATSLASTPGERSSLSTASSSALDTSTPPTSGANTTSGHIPSVLNAGADIGQPGTSKSQSCETLTDPTETDSCSSASSDQTYDNQHDPGLCTSDASVNSVVSSIAATFSSSSSLVSAGDHKAINTQSTGNQVLIGGIQNVANDTKSSSSNTSPSKDMLTVMHSGVVASSKLYAEKVESQNDNSLTHGKQSQTSNNLSSIGSGIFEKVPVETDGSCTTSRGIKRTKDEMEASDETLSPQKNKKRCFSCKCKLELAQRTIGRCRCDRVFCALHRLPELHDCEFNHKEDGRREAREKMIKPTRHLGPSYRREDHS
ncbi:AN1-type zinc finger protein 3-like [Physella acuta]|uniref:AN1-type zinc finger protein 3-like n=1 Tax=Physella acuta TaxID=109671 RepID=UPI0027DC8196|nr:AN1-type zinc finger protein 3-like [Physella acuta]